MRSVRILLATGAATAAVAIAAPIAHADVAGDDSSYGTKAPTAVNQDDWGVAKDPKHDPETYRGGGDPWSTDHDEPRGGMRTGGGALATTGVTAGGLAVLAVIGTGVYALRRNRVSEGVA